MNGVEGVRSFVLVIIDHCKSLGVRINAALDHHDPLQVVVPNNVPNKEKTSCHLIYNSNNVLRVISEVPSIVISCKYILTDVFEHVIPGPT